MGPQDQRLLQLALERLALGCLGEAAAESLVQDPKERIASWITKNGKGEEVDGSRRCRLHKISKFHGDHTSGLMI
jgi:hypothetical protein